LKPGGGLNNPHAGLQFPALISAGPIEASTAGNHGLSRQPFPALISAGPIEAHHSRARLGKQSHISGADQRRPN